jgi:hypothetical protein
MSKSLVTVAAMLVLGLAGVSGASNIIAIDNAVQAPNQSYGNALGLDFTVNSVQAITVRELGAFVGNPSTYNYLGVDGASGIGVQIYRVTGATGVPVGPEVFFNPSNPGTPVNGDVFQAIAPLSLPAGNYSVVAFNDPNSNSGNGSIPRTLNSGNGAITIGGATYGSPASFAGTAANYPSTTDSNFYAAGTFQFTPAPEPSTMVLGGLGSLGLLIAVRRRRKA